MREDREVKITIAEVWWVCPEDAGWYLVAVGAAGAARVAATGPAAPAAPHLPVLGCALVAVAPHHVGQAEAPPRLVVAGHVLPRSQPVAGAS